MNNSSGRLDFPGGPRPRLPRPITPRVKTFEIASARHAPRLYAWCRGARRETTLAPPIAFHVAPAAARAAIAAEGLDTVQRSPFPELDARPEAVFLWGTLTDALYYAWGTRGEVWAVSVVGLTLASDPNEMVAWMVSHAIAPPQLQWLGAPPWFEPWPAPLKWAARRGWPEANLVGDAIAAHVSNLEPVP